MINRANPPILPKFKKFNIPTLHKFNLENKLEVFFIERNELPIIKMNFILRKGSLQDADNKWGTANLTAMLIDESADKLNALEIDTLIEKLGAHFTITVNQDYTIFSILSLKENFEQVLELIAKILIKPNFPEEDFKREKAKALDNLIRLKDEPSFVADWATSYFLFKNSAYRFPNIGTTESIKNIELKDVVDYYNNYYKAEEFQIVCAGNIEKDELDLLLNKYLKEFPRSEKQVSTNINLETIKNTIYLINKNDAPQSEIRVANFSSKRIDKDYFAKKIMNSILGGQFSSRLNHNLREEKGITYGIHSDFHYSQFWGFLECTTAVDTDNTVLALKEIRKEIFGVIENIEEKEIEFTKSYLTKIFPQYFETISKITSNFVNAVLYGLDEEFFKSYLLEIEKVTKEEVFNAAQNNLKPNNQIIVIVGNAQKLRELLKAEFSEFEIIENEIEALGI